jgi:hypothetical protein
MSKVDFGLFYSGHIKAYIRVKSAFYSCPQTSKTIRVNGRPLQNLPKSTGKLTTTLECSSNNLMDIPLSTLSTLFLSQYFPFLRYYSVLSALGGFVIYSSDLQATACANQLEIYEI